MESRKPLDESENEVVQPFSWWRVAKLALIACTGIGALWLLGRTYTVSPGKVATVTNNYSGKMRIIGPGMHILESPFETFNSEVPDKKQCNIKRFENVKVRTADGVEISTTVDLRYVIQNPIDLTKAINGPYEKALIEVISSSLSNIIATESFTYSQIISARVPLVISKKLEESKAPTEEKKSESFKLTSNIDRIGALLLKKIEQFCNNWGIHISLSQIVDPKATDPSVERRYQENANTIIEQTNAFTVASVVQDRLNIEAKGNAERLALTTKAEGERIEALAIARARETTIATAAQVERLNKLTTAMHAAPELGSKIMALDTQVAIADKLPKSGMMFSNPFNLFPAPEPASSTVTERKTIDVRPRLVASS